MIRGPILSAARERLEQAMRPVDGWPPAELRGLVQAELDASAPGLQGRLSYVSRSIPGVLRIAQIADAELREQPDLNDYQREQRTELRNARQEVLWAAQERRATQIRVRMGFSALRVVLGPDGDDPIGKMQIKEVLVAARAGWDVGLIEDEKLDAALGADVVTSVLAEPMHGLARLYEQSANGERVSADPSEVQGAVMLHRQVVGLADDFMHPDNVRRYLAKMAGVELPGEKPKRR